MLTVEEHNFIKESIPFYAHLNIDEQGQFNQAISRRMLRKGDKLSHPNECSGLVVIESGRVRAFIMSEDGREITLFRLLEKDICLLTASCIFRNLNFTVYFEVEKDSTVYFLSSTVFEEISSYNIHVKEYMLEQMASRFSSAMWVMEQVVFGSLSKRVASFIIDQMELEHSRTLTITHEAIAKNIGSAREVVSRMLKHLESDGILRMTRGTLIVDDLEKLKQLSQ
ncbi:Crp/Fnr family transcriptional regulator [Neobacillus sp. LXY-4]|uniref:Crp/Fnr family transcriptional regulator n=1 Tax=Neobacillus sp. LXY-4 TaxID=3379826 RepID=UPI003EE1159C